MLVHNTKYIPGMLDKIQKAASDCAINGEVPDYIMLSSEEYNNFFNEILNKVGHWQSNTDNRGRYIKYHGYRIYKDGI